MALLKRSLLRHKRALTSTLEGHLLLIKKTPPQTLWTGGWVKPWRPSNKLDLGLSKRWPLTLVLKFCFSRTNPRWGLLSRIICQPPRLRTNWGLKLSRPMVTWWGLSSTQMRTIYHLPQAARGYLPLEVLSCTSKAPWVKLITWKGSNWPPLNLSSKHSERMIWVSSKMRQGS
jgi:hypothetical protein